MPTNEPVPHYYQEDEIDLKELFKILWLKKNLIIVLTLAVTIIAGIYAFNKTPIYGSSALVEIGHYKLNNNNNNNNNNNKVLLDSASELVKKLNILFIDLVKKDKDRDWKISSISVAKGLESFVEIKAEGISNEVISNEIIKVVDFVKDKHQIILDDIKSRREFKIKNIDTKIHNIKNKEIKLLQEKINIKEANLDQYQSHLVTLNSNIVNIEDTNPTLTALKLIEKNDTSKIILQLNLQLLDMNKRKDELETTVISDLLESKRIAESMLLPHNYKNSAIVGEIITNDYPIKPKKRLIVAVAFVAGFMLSIFLVFIMNAFRQEDEKVAS